MVGYLPSMSACTGSSGFYSQDFKRKGERESNYDHVITQSWQTHRSHCFHLPGGDRSCHTTVCDHKLTWGQRHHLNFRCWKQEINKIQWSSDFSVSAGRNKSFCAYLMACTPVKSWTQKTGSGVYFVNTHKWLGTVTHALIDTGEAGGFLWVQGQPCLHHSSKIVKATKVDPVSKIKIYIYQKKTQHT